MVGAAVFVIAENYLRALIGDLSRAAADLGLPLLPSLLHPDRWLLWLGVMFILAVRFAPRGIIGRVGGKVAASGLSARAQARAQAQNVGGNGENENGGANNRDKRPPSRKPTKRYPRPCQSLPQG